MSTNRKRVIFTALGLVLIIGSLIVLAIVSSFIEIYKPIPFQEAKFDEVAHWVALHRSPRSPMIKLPEKYQRYSVTGAAYVTGNYIFIPTWIGRVTILPSFMFDDEQYCQGYLFSNSKLVYATAADGYDPDFQRPWICIYAPNFSGLYGFDKPHGTVQVQLMLDKQVNSRWYAMETLFDPV